MAIMILSNIENMIKWQIRILNYQMLLLLRLKYRNLSAHWDKLQKEYEKLRDLLISENEFS